jgi:hypothetical protein
LAQVCQSGLRGAIEQVGVAGTVRRAKRGVRWLDSRQLCQPSRPGAFPSLAAHAVPDFANDPVRQQIVDVPVQALDRAQMAGQPRTQPAQSAPNVEVIALLKSQHSQAAHPRLHALWQLDDQNVRSRLGDAHGNSVIVLRRMAIASSAAIPIGKGKKLLFVNT